MENADRIFEDKLQKGMTGQLSDKDLRNRKHRPTAWEWQTETHAYWRERDHCGWTDRPTKLERPDTNTSFNMSKIELQIIHHDLDLKCIFVFQHACFLLLLVFLTFIFHKVV